MHNTILLLSSNTLYFFSLIYYLREAISWHYYEKHVLTFSWNILQLFHISPIVTRFINLLLGIVHLVKFFVGLSKTKYEYSTFGDFDDFFGRNFFSLNFFFSLYLVATRTIGKEVQTRKNYYEKH